MSSLVGIGSNRQEALEDLEIALTISVKVAGVNKLSCGVMIVGVSVNVMMFGWNLDDILLIFSRKNSEKVEANFLGREKIGKMEANFEIKGNKLALIFYFFCKNLLV